MAQWQFKTESECDLFLTHVGYGVLVGDSLTVSVFGEANPGIPGTITRQNYSAYPKGRTRITPPNDSGELPYEVGGIFGPGPWGSIMVMWPGIYLLETLEDASEYVCLTAKAGHKVNSVFHEYEADAVHDVLAETWAVALGGPATINGIAIPAYGIAHKVSGQMNIQTSHAVVCLTEAN
jgi:hypothetical protein